MRKTLESRQCDHDIQMNEYCEMHSIARCTPRRVKDALEKAYGISLDGILPSDNVSCLGDGTDFGDLRIRLEQELEVAVGDSEWDMMDGTFGAILELVDRHGDSE